MPARTRLHTYGAAMGVGLAGALFGALFDSVTVQLSPDYFVLGKGLSEAALPAGAWGVGIRAGGSFGLMAGLLWVYRIQRSAPPWSPRLSRAGARTMGLAVAMAALFGLALSRLDPMGLGDHVVPLVGPARGAAFLRVWWVHLGAYVGGAVGVVWGVVSLRAPGTP